MNFTSFNKKMQEHLNKMTKNTLYVTTADGLWDIYLNNFSADVRQEHDCSACRRFIKSFGHAVNIIGGKIITVWDFETTSLIYGPVIKALGDYVRGKQISDFYRKRSVGISENYEDVNGNIIRWEHMHVKVPRTSVLVREAKDTFKRSLDEISEESILTVLDLIAQNSLYRGEEWRKPLEVFLAHKRTYGRTEDKDLYAWEYCNGSIICRIRNSSIGTLLTSNDDLDEAVRKYESIVAPSNYKRPKAIFTARMLKNAEYKVKELGYLDSLERRFAVKDDITIDNLLFVNRTIKKSSIFGDMLHDLPSRKLSRVEEVPVERFINQVLPNANGLEIYLEPRHSPNLVSLIAPAKPSKSMFKWANGFSWAYNGNVADSMKERVKAFGGRVDGVLRFSIQWNDNDDNHDDLDAHCRFQDSHIYYGHKREADGKLDVDIIHPNGVAIENIIFQRVADAEYKFYVNCFNSRGAKSGFRAEIEFNGEVREYMYSEPLRHDTSVDVAVVTVKDGKFSVKDDLTANTKDLWGLRCQCYHKVDMVMFSPNYWEEQIGNKHLFFMLGCKNPGIVNGFFNEYLSEDLMEHKHVFEALGSRMAVSGSGLSGLGFSLTQRNDLNIKVTGSHTREIKVVI